MKNTAGAALLAAAAVVAATAWSAANGEVSRKPTAAPPSIAGPTIKAQPVTGGVPLQVQCWQKGVRIVDQAGLSGLSLNAVTRQRSVSFKRVDNEQPSVFILPFDDSLCLIQPER